jgi:hypothetical protein
LDVLYGGAICTKDYRGGYSKIGQWSTNAGNQLVPYSFEFSDNSYENLYMDLNNNIYNANGQFVGRGVPVR